MPPLPPNLSVLGYIGVFLLFLGVILFLAGFNILKINQVTILPSKRTWISGIVLIFLGATCISLDIIGSQAVNKPTVSTSIFPLPSSDSPVSEINSRMWYRLTNQFLGEGKSLDTRGDGDNAPFMAQSGDQSGQYWKITPTGNGYYRLTNEFLNESRALDTRGDGDNAPFMAQSGDQSGQYWKITPIEPIE